MGSNPENPKYYLGKVYSTDKRKWVMATAKTSTSDGKWMNVKGNTSIYYGRPVYWFSGEADIVLKEVVDGYSGACLKDMGYGTTSAVNPVETGDGSCYWAKTCTTVCLACQGRAVNQAHSANSANDFTFASVTYPSTAEVKHKNINRPGTMTYSVTINKIHQDITVTEETVGSRQYIPHSYRVKSMGEVEDTLVETDPAGKIKVYYYFGGIKEDKYDYDLYFESND